ncbi:hypothetical protein ACEWY4_001204 [Coilia grayii]|uniref:Integrase catalytic domain-containing protein n=1 Tax=Coilia grayii TaxID=363190 RepID=A0ABD1KYU1_9TELE
MAPSQPGPSLAPPTPPVLAVYPFQAVCSDFFMHRGVHYLVIVDRYSNWPIISRSAGGATDLICHLHRAFATYVTPEELASDGGPEFTSDETRSFLHRWGVHHRLSLVAFPHSNCHAEIGVKMMKRLITDNMGPNGDLDTNAVQRVILQYRNTPDPDTKLSPAMCVFGRPIRDFIPIPPGKYRPHETWRETLKAREEALPKRHIRAADTWAEHTKHLLPLRVGDFVRIQNQTGPHPKKWDRTGSIVEVCQHDQYVVKMGRAGSHFGTGDFCASSTQFALTSLHLDQSTMTLGLVSTNQHWLQCRCHLTLWVARYRPWQCQIPLRRQPDRLQVLPCVGHSALQTCRWCRPRKSLVLRRLPPRPLPHCCLACRRQQAYAGPPGGPVCLLGIRTMLWDNL